MQKCKILTLGNTSSWPAVVLTTKNCIGSHSKVKSAHQNSKKKNRENPGKSFKIIIIIRKENTYTDKAQPK